MSAEDEEVAFLLTLRDEFTANLEKAGEAVVRFDAETRRAEKAAQDQAKEAEKLAAAEIKRAEDRTKRQGQATLAIQEATAKLRMETEAERALWDVQNGRFSDFDEQAKAQVVQLAARYDAEKRAIEAEEEAARQAELSWTELNAALEVGIKGFQLLSGVVRSVAGTMQEWTSDAIRHADAVRRISDSTGIAVEQVQELQFALRDGGPEAATQGLQTFAKVLGDALVNPASEAAKTFKALGVELRDAQGYARDTGSVFMDFADRLQGLGSEAEQTAIMSKTLGEEAGKKLASSLANGSAGLREQADRARELGIIMDRDAIAATKRYEDEVRQLTAVWEAFKREVSVSVMPVLQALVENMLEGHRKGEMFRGTIVGMSKAWEVFRAAAAGVDVASVQVADLNAEILKTAQLLNAARQSGSTGSASEFMGLSPDVDPEAEFRLQVQLRQLLDKRDKILAEREASILGPAVEEVSSFPDFEAKPSAPSDPDAAAKAEKIAELIKRTREENELFRLDSFERLELLMDRELELVGSNLEARAAIEEKYQNLKEEQFIKDDERRMADFEKQMEDREREFELAEEKVAREEEINTRIVESAMSRADKLRAIQAQELAEFTGTQEQRRKLEEKHSKDRIRLDADEKGRRIQNQIQTMSAVEGLTMAFGIRSHGLQKAMTISRAIMDFNAAKMRAAAQTGVAAPASMAMIAGLLLPIIGALKSSSPFEGGSAGGGGGGGFSMPDVTAPESSGISPAAPSAAPIEAAPEPARNQILVELVLAGGMVLMDDVTSRVEEAIVANARDGRTDVVVRRSDRLS